MIIAIDPGNEKSAVVCLRDGLIHEFNCSDNATVLDYLRSRWNCKSDVLYIEMIASYGMPVGAEIFETCVWIGRFMQGFGADDCVRVPRIKIKNHICHSSKAKDANIRQAIIDRFGGKERAIGNKKAPGPLYGITGDEWAALALALYAHDTQAARDRGAE